MSFNKYDRQIRLWDADGQARLSDSHILFLGYSLSTIETMKDLVLPGCGSITLVDDQIVNERHIANSFFLIDGDLGKNLGSCITARVNELNPDVNIQYINSKPIDYIKELNNLKQYHLVILSQHTYTDAVKIESTCLSLNIPMIYIYLHGCIGIYRLSSRSLFVVEGKNKDNLDLRLNHPPQALIEWINSENDHKKLNYILLLLKAHQQYKTDSSLKIIDNPRSYVDSILESYFPNPTDELNEAKSFTYKLFTPCFIPYNLREIFDNPQINQIDDNTNIFWITALIFKQFYEHYSYFPLTGSIPDLHMNTNDYLKFQNIYKTQAESELKLLLVIYQSIVEKYNLTVNVPKEYIQLWQKNLTTVTFIETSTILNELSNPNLSELKSSSTSTWYYALQMYFKFKAVSDRDPTTVDELNSVKDAINQLYQLTPTDIEPKYIKEVIRQSGLELPSPASILGGITSQEAIKIITQKFIPLDNTYIYCGVDGSSVKLRM